MQSIAAICLVRIWNQFCKMLFKKLFPENKTTRFFFFFDPQNHSLLSYSIFSFSGFENNIKYYRQWVLFQKSIRIQVSKTVNQTSSLSFQPIRCLKLSVWFWFSGLRGSHSSSRMKMISLL